MAASLFSRLYRRAMQRVLEPAGFQRKGSLFWRERGGLLHIIALDRSPFDGAFTAGVAIQAVMWPAEDFYLSVGSRLDRFAPGIPVRWEVPSTRPEIEQVLERFSQTVARHALPWLDRFQSPRDVLQVDAADQWGIRPIERSARTWIVAVCALAAEDWVLAETKFRDIWPFYAAVGADAPEWDRRDKLLLQDILELLQRRDVETIRRRLEEYSASTRAALGLEGKT